MHCRFVHEQRYTEDREEVCAGVLRALQGCLS